MRRTKLIRISEKMYKFVGVVSEQEDLTLSKALDLIISKFIKNNSYYDIN